MPIPACSTITDRSTESVLRLAKAADFLIVPIMVLVQSIAILTVILFELVVIPIVALPALAALSVLRVFASLAR